jgi:hypothetical protein
VFFVVVVVVDKYNIIMYIEIFTEVKALDHKESSLFFIPTSQFQMLSTQILDVCVLQPMYALFRTAPDVVIVA